ncbi:MAG: hypothetical protein HLUCCA11_22505 [Phormidesmis priestleyi Ana]|uniref:Uncharacterized protein n=1 Tax=Phormidesmis priestleyi Ana TaxID=1666911 RepID=A0A0P8BTC6_9CYAN|nr:MAG: hypothetical protein HLUCCA11_22505 [Phormidesmis priestleyi Ana]
MSKKVAPTQSLGETVEDLHIIFAELDKSYDNRRPIGRSMIMAKAVEAIKNKPALSGGIAAAMKNGTIIALEAAVAHPILKPVIARLAKA